MEDTQTKLQKIANIVSLVVLIIAIVYFVFKWTSLPDTIPVHYNFAGEVDRMGSKNEMIVLPIILLIMNAGFFFLEKAPQLWNTGVTITEANRIRVYTLIRNMLSIIRLMITLFFSYLILTILKVFPMGNWAIMICIIAIAMTIIYYMVRVFKTPKNEKR